MAKRGSQWELAEGGLLPLPILPGCTLGLGVLHHWGGVIIPTLSNQAAGCKCIAVLPSPRLEHWNTEGLSKVN